jgi:hypothetical protein
MRETARSDSRALLLVTQDDLATGLSLYQENSEEQFQCITVKSSAAFWRFPNLPEFITSIMCCYAKGGVYDILAHGLFSPTTESLRTSQLKVYGERAPTHYRKNRVHPVWLPLSLPFTSVMLVRDGIEPPLQMGRATHPPVCSL